MIQNAVETRLRMLMPYIEKWPEVSNYILRNLYGNKPLRQLLCTG